MPKLSEQQIYDIEGQAWQVAFTRYVEHITQAFEAHGANARDVIEALAAHTHRHDSFLMLGETGAGVPPCVVKSTVHFTVQPHDIVAAVAAFQEKLRRDQLPDAGESFHVELFDESQECIEKTRLAVACLGGVLSMDEKGWVIHAAGGGDASFLCHVVRHQAYVKAVLP